MEENSDIQTHKTEKSVKHFSQPGHSVIKQTAQLFYLAPAWERAGA